MFILTPADAIDEHAVSLGLSGIDFAECHLHPNQKDAVAMLMDHTLAVVHRACFTYNDDHKGLADIMVAFDTSDREDDSVPYPIMGVLFRNPDTTGQTEVTFYTYTITKG